MSEWQPIETAPTDHIEVLVYEDGYGVLTAKCVSGNWYPTAQGEMAHDGVGDLMGEVFPICWMPLPEPPTSKRGQSVETENANR